MKKLFFIFIFVFLLVPVFLYAWQNIYIIENFDNYNLGNFYNQSEDWTLIYHSVPTAQIVNNYSYSNPYSLVYDLRSSLRYNLDTTTTADIIYSYYYFASSSYSADLYFQVYDHSLDANFYHRLNFTNYNYLALGHFAYGVSNVYPVATTSKWLQEWIKVEIDYRFLEEKVRYRLDEQEWTQFYPTRSVSVNPDISSFSFYNSNNYQVGHLHNYFLDNFRVSYSVPEYEEQCEAGNCLMCETEELCLNAGCFWYSSQLGGYCLYSEPEIEESWSSFYNENSKFSTPTAFISFLASSSEPFIILMSSWISGFADRFNLSEAEAKGSQLGEAIPKARGYLDFINSIFGNIPISEIFIIYVIVLLGVVIFRIIRQIKKLFFV